MKKNSSDNFLKDVINIANKHFDTIVSSDFNIVKENYRNVISEFVTVLINMLDNYFELDNRHFLLNYYSNLFDDDRLYFIIENEKKYIFSLSGELDEEIKKTIKQIISPESKKNEYFSIKDFFENKKKPSSLNGILNSSDISKLFIDEEIKEDYSLYKSLISSLTKNGLELITLPLTNGVENKLIANLNIITDKGFYDENIVLLKEIQFNLSVIFSYIRSYERLIEIKYHAIKSAKAAIMARNISHNLGSHVIYYIKDAILGFEDIHTYPHLAEFSKKGDDIIFPNHIYKELKASIKDIKKEEREFKAPFLRGLVRFLNYIQERHDYIATISNDHIPYSGAINFKDFVFDIIIPDSKIERHKTSERELANYKEQNLLLDFIAKSENLNRASINIYYKTFDKKGKFTPTVAQSTYEKVNRESQQSDSHLKDLRNIELSLPSGIMGRQAFFSIFENFIRNTAKHSQKNSNKTLEIVFCVKKEDDYYQFMLYDEKNTTTRDILKNKIQKALEEPYTKEDGQLSEANKGIKEMRISAAWLRGLQVENIDEQKLLLKANGTCEKLIEATLINPEKPEEELPETNKKGTLCYTFKVPVSKKMIIITEKKEINETNQFNIVKPEEYKKRGFLKNYRLTVIDESLNDKEIDDLKKYTPVRILIINLDTLSDKSQTEKMYNNLYYKWICDFINIENKSIFKFNIYIADKNMSFKQKNKKNYSKIIANTSFDSTVWENSLETPSIIFRTHNDTEEEFKEFKDNNPAIYNHTSFIEGISGHNSTDRLLRHEELNQEWYYKMLESALVKITILDERIYDHYKAENAENYNENYLNDLKNNLDTIEKLQSFIENNILDHVNVEQSETFKKLKENIGYKTKYKSNNYEQSINYYSQKLYNELLIRNVNNINQTILNKKNIFIYNLEKNNKEELLLLELNQEHKKLKLDTLNEIVKSHFVCIHQGILEKLMPLDTTDGDNIEKAICKIKKLFPLYSNGKYIVLSGRSKPNNLPLDVGFAQFSSVEAALNDCKFSLSELVFNAITEN